MLATAGWDDQRGVTVVQRSKEEASDYRYLPDPDLVPVRVDRDWIDSVKSSIGELPADRRNRFVRQYDLSDYDAGVLIDQGKAYVDYFEEVIKTAGSTKMASNWMQQDVLRTLNERSISIDQFGIVASELGALIANVKSGRINTHSAREIFAEMLETEYTAEHLIRDKGVEQVSDKDTLRETVIDVIIANPRLMVDYNKGKKRQQIEGFTRGLVMKQTRGKANSKLVQQLVAEELSKRSDQ